MAGRTDGGGERESQDGVAAADVEDVVAGRGGEVLNYFGGELGDEGGGCCVSLVGC